MIGDFLYELTPRDLSGLPMQCEHAYSTVTANLATVTNQDWYTIPIDKVLVVTCLAMRITATGGVTPKILRTVWEPLYEGLLTPPAVAAHSIPTPSGYTGAAYHWSSERIFFLPPGTLTTQAEFSAAGASNTINCTILGYFIPRGNFGVG